MSAEAGMRGLAFMAVTLAGLLVQQPPADPSGQLLTIPQEDRLRSRISPPSASLSADGRYVALTSYARLSASDSDDFPDIYVIDRFTGSVTLASTDPSVRAGFPRLSADGRFVAYEETLVNTGPQPVRLVIRDLVDGRVTRLNGEGAHSWTGGGALSARAEVIAFVSSANMTAGPDDNGERRDVYALDPSSGAIRRVSVGSHGRQSAHGESFGPTINASGRFVVFTSTSDLNTVTGTAHRAARLYLHDLDSRVTRCLTRATSRSGSSYSAAISDDGRYVAFVSEDSGIVAADRNRTGDVFLHDVLGGSTILVSRSVAGGAANGASRNPAISSDGRFVVFQSDASDLVCAARCQPSEEDINLLPDIFLFDRIERRVKRISGNSGTPWMEESVAPAVNGDATIVAFSSRHPIDAQDVDNDFDLFVWVSGASKPANPRDIARAVSAWPGRAAAGKSVH